MHIKYNIVILLGIELYFFLHHCLYQNWQSVAILLRTHIKYTNLLWFCFERTTYYFPHIFRLNFSYSSIWRWNWNFISVLHMKILTYYMKCVEYISSLNVNAKGRILYKDVRISIQNKNLGPIVHADLFWTQVAFLNGNL